MRIGESRLSLTEHKKRRQNDNNNPPGKLISSHDPNCRRVALLQIGTITLLQILCQIELIRLKCEIAQLAVHSQITQTTLVLKHVQRQVVVVIERDLWRYAAQTQANHIGRVLIGEHLCIIRDVRRLRLTLVEHDLNCAKRDAYVDLVPGAVRDVGEWE